MGDYLFSMFSYFPFSEKWVSHGLWMFRDDSTIKRDWLKSWCGRRLHDDQALSLTCLDMNTKGVFLHSGFPGSSHGKEFACYTGDPDPVPGLGRSPVGDNGNPLQYSCLENPIDRGDWQSAVHGVPKSQTRLSDSTHTQAGNLLTLNLLQWLQRHLQ